MSVTCFEATSFPSVNIIICKFLSFYAVKVDNVQALRKHINGMHTEIQLLYTAVSTWTLEQQHKRRFMFIARIQHKIVIKKNCNETNVIREESERFPNELKMKSRRKDAQLLNFTLVHMCLKNIVVLIILIITEIDVTTSKLCILYFFSHVQYFHNKATNCLCRHMLFI
jgi:hypothetical protein